MLPSETLTVFTVSYPLKDVIVNGLEMGIVMMKTIKSNAIMMVETVVVKMLTSNSVQNVFVWKKL